MATPSKYSLVVVAVAEKYTRCHWPSLTGV